MKRALLSFSAVGVDVGNRGPRDRTDTGRRGERARLGEIRRAVVIVALPGFLGTGRDWDFLREAGFPIVTPSVSEGPGRVGGADDVILGYSMGGRLALQALLHGAKYKAAVFISTRVSATAEGREEWARRFERDDWSTLMRDWNAQPLFGGHAVARDERDCDRATLAHALRAWSPGVLAPVAARLRELKLPTLWIAGANDAKYTAEAARGATGSRGEAVIIGGAGHRVPWEAPDALSETIRSFVERE